jgi:UTP--glucose-1-phosphate uridylyltransferase
MKIRKAVITAAGWGTRFLPITRSQPKEMLPLVDKPLIHYSVEEAIKSGIKQIIVVTAMGKRAIEDYFDRSIELEHFLQQKHEKELLERMREISRMVDIVYVRQKEQKGLGHAVLMAKDVVGDEPFALMLPDDIIDSAVPGLKQMMPVYQQYHASVIAVENVADKKDVSKYGIIKPELLKKGVYRVLDLVEKPEPAKAPSRLRIVGRYLLTPEIFGVIKKTPPGKNGEIQLTQALHTLRKVQDIYACELSGTVYDAGTPFGWLKANVHHALTHRDIAPEFREYLKGLLK